MIISDNPTPSFDDFKSLMNRVDILLNEEALRNDSLRRTRGGIELEPFVEAAASECAIGTPFEGTIKRISGASFPDIVAAKLYGIEVKSTQQNHWTSIGSSILESTRISGVKRIFLTFGKLSDPIQFKSRPYEECLSGIAVTHYPRYQIDMNLNQGETIFDKMGIPYDDLRKMSNPVIPVADYYRSLLRPGESLWWTGSQIETAVPPTVRLWSALSAKEKNDMKARFYVFFPECIISMDKSKYSRLTLWLVTQRGIVYPSIRDAFSAGGQLRQMGENGDIFLMPAVYNKISLLIKGFKEVLFNTPSDDLSSFWHEPIEPNRGLQWIKLVLKEETDVRRKRIAESVLRKLFQDNKML